MFEKSPEMLDAGPEEMESEPDLELQLGYVLDELHALKEKGEVDQEDIQRFLTTRDMIEKMGDEKMQKVEKAALLRQYQNLIRSKRPE